MVFYNTVCVIFFDRLAEAWLINPYNSDVVELDVFAFPYEIVMKLNARVMTLFDSLDGRIPDGLLELMQRVFFSFRLICEHYFQLKRCIMLVRELCFEKEPRLNMEAYMEKHKIFSNIAFAASTIGFEKNEVIRFFDKLRSKFKTRLPVQNIRKFFCEELLKLSEDVTSMYTAKTPKSLQGVPVAYYVYQKLFNIIRGFFDGKNVDKSLELQQVAALFGYFEIQLRSCAMDILAQNVESHTKMDGLRSLNDSLEYAKLSRVADWQLGSGIWDNLFANVLHRQGRMAGVPAWPTKLPVGQFLTASNSSMSFEDFALGIGDIVKGRTRNKKTEEVVVKKEVKKNLKTKIKKKPTGTSRQLRPGKSAQKPKEKKPKPTKRITKLPSPKPPKLRLAATKKPRISITIPPPTCKTSTPKLKPAKSHYLARESALSLRTSKRTIQRPAKFKDSA